MFISVISFLFAVSLLIIVHEFGHLLFAKLSGMEVREFSLGFGKPALSIMIGGTKYSLRPIPFGGYVNIREMDIDAEAWQKGKGFLERPFYQKMSVLLAGSLMNLFLAVVIFGSLGVFVGKVVGVKNEIERVLPGTPAEMAGIRKGDKIIAVGEVRTQDVAKLRQEIQKNPGKMLSIEIERGGKVFKIWVTPQSVTSYKREKDRVVKTHVGQIGVVFKSITKKMGFAEAVWAGFRDTYYLAKLVVMFPYLAITKKVPAEVGGPIAIARITSEGARMGFPVLMERIAMISVTLAVFNLFPIPGLDGGILFILIINSIYAFFFKRNLDYRKIALVNSIGVAFLLTLMAVLTLFDIRKLFQ